MSPEPSQAGVVELVGSRLTLGERTLWSDLDLTIRPGEFVAVLGSSGSGKTTLLRTMLGRLPLSAGTVTVNGRIGYIPQQTNIDDTDPMALRSRDLVGFGVDGERWGIGFRGRHRRRELVDAALADVGATDYADAPLGVLSGGEQQRLRVAQALVRDPALLLCDEPLASLDLTNQQRVVSLLDRRRREAGTAVVFVTHEINPVLSLVDRVLYLANGRFRTGTAEEVLTTESLSDLYGSRIEVLDVNGRLVVVGGNHDPHCEDLPHQEGLPS